MKVAIIGGGTLGLSLARFLQRKGHQPHVFEKSPYLGGLACSYDYGGFVWDKFYHVILPQDREVLALLDDLGLSEQLRWRPTQTGYFANEQFYSLSSTAEMLRFPLLGWMAKFRMGLATLYASRLAKPDSLYQVTAAAWLSKIFGASNYEVFWKPLLRARFGEYHDRVSATYIWAAIHRLFGARDAVSNKEAMGYVHGGYDRINGTFQEVIESQGGRVNLSSEIKAAGLASEAPAEPGGEGESAACWIRVADENGIERHEWFDKVIFTAPKRFARSIASEGILRTTDLGAAEKPLQYFGVVCMAMVLRRQLTPYYILNIADERIPLTGVIEMTSLIDSAEETNGRSLVFLPKYLDSDDPLLRVTDDEIYERFVDSGLKLLFPNLAPTDIESWHVQRAQFVQPLPLVEAEPREYRNLSAAVDQPFVVVNSSLLACPALNNDEVVGLARQTADQIGSAGQ